MQNSGNNIIIEQRVLPAWANKGGLQRCFIYKGNSMEPTFRPGQLLYVRPCVQDISPGDVVVFNALSKNNWVVHRVVSITASGLITRGDNNSQFDTYPVDSTRVIGRVEMVEDKGRTIAQWWPQLNRFVCRKPYDLIISRPGAVENK